jgi:hypothetical protein
MEIRRAPALQLSDAVRVPSVVGLLDPTVLVPRSLVGTLADDEVEAILVHELSHLQRGDLLANAVQRVVATLLFFHPVVRWISRRIDEDREMCCDDLVIRMGVPKRTYARALARTALSGPGVPLVALGAATGDVAARVRRLIERGTTPEVSSSVVPAVALVVITLLGLGAATRALVPLTTRIASAAPAWEVRVLADVPFPYTVNATDPAGEFTLSVERGRVVRARVAGTDLPNESIRQRGAHVTLLGDRPAGSFSVTLLATGGIEWSARSIVDAAPPSP